MRVFIWTIMALLIAVACSAGFVFAQPLAKQDSRTTTNRAFLLGPPKGKGPVVVRASFQLNDINEINDENETFEFSGILTLKWRDERQAFDPAVAGVDEKVYQGAYQVNEISPAWFPQLVLVNESGLYEKHGVVLRVQPDGSQTLIETLNAVAKAEFNMRRFPFDRQRLKAVFEVLGFDESEVVLQVESNASPSQASQVRMPQWLITAIKLSTQSRPATQAEAGRASSELVLDIDAKRESFFMSRLVIFPLILIVFLSFSVFWMDRASLGDRINVSFVGILTGVAYIIVMSEILPRIAYVTLMNAILNLSFLTMAGTVVINLLVGVLDMRGKSELGDRVDRRCRWAFPLGYLGLLVMSFVVAFWVF